MKSIQIFGDIGTNENEYSNKQFVDELKALAPIDELMIEIHSQGGNIFEGFAIHDTIKTLACPVTTRIYNAMSIASVIAFAPLTMTNGKVEMAENGWVMIHDPRAGMPMGTAEDFRTSADRLDKFCDRMVKTYAQALNKSEDDVRALMSAEAWFNSDEALAVGIADTKIEPVEMVARFDARQFKNPPANLSRNFKYVKANELKPGTEVVASSGETITATNEPVGDKSMTVELKPATLPQLKKLFPKASNDFIVKAMEEENTEADATAAYIAMIEEENAAMSDELTALRAQVEEMSAQSEEEPEASEEVVTAQSSEEDLPIAKFDSKHNRTRLNQPVANVSSNRKSKTATDIWNAKVDELQRTGIARHEAVKRASVKFPEVRAQMIAEANPGREINIR